MMNARRLVSVMVVSHLVGLAMAARGEEPANAPIHFRQLLHVGDTVLLRTVNDHPAYTIQLLSEAQAIEVQTARAAFLELSQRVKVIEAKLETEARLSERAAMFVEREPLEAEIASLPDTKHLGRYAYQITQVGEDFVALKTLEIERFVPLHSIRDLYRTDELPFSRDSSLARRSSPDSEQISKTVIRLKYVTAESVAEIMHQFYSDSKAKLTVDAAANMLVVEGDRTSLRQIQSLVRTLDAAGAAPKEPKAPDNERGQ